MYIQENYGMRPRPVETYEALTAAYLADKMKKDPAITAVTAGTPKVLGFGKELRKQFPKQFVDVGVAEGHAVAMISGIAKGGRKACLWSQQLLFAKSLRSAFI